MTATDAWQQRADVVVIGTGVAGLAAALAAHRRGRKVVVLSKANDTATLLRAGRHRRGAAGHRRLDRRACRRHGGRGCRAVRSGCGALDRGRRLPRGGRTGRRRSAFRRSRARDSGRCTREGGHSRRRIIHAGGDATGAEVQRALDAAAARLDIRRNHVALELLQATARSTGVLVLNDDGLGSRARAVGDPGDRRTRSSVHRAPPTPRARPATASRWRCGPGLPVSDLEFIQFHPTMLYDGDAGGRRPLITEAVRGEGAILH